MAFESGEMDGHDFTFIAIGILIGLMMLGTILERLGFTNFTNVITDPNATSEDLTFTESVLKSDLDLADNVVSIENTVVRQAPAGPSLGGQNKRAKGRIVEGPVMTDGVEWWRVSYESAPSGWVLAENLSNKVSMFTFFNIIPITFGFLKPVAIIFSVIILVLILMVRLKIKNINKIAKKKAQLKKEQSIFEKGHDHKQPDNYVSDVKTDTSGEYESEIYKKSDFNEGGGDLELPVDNLPIGKKPKTEDPSNRRWANIQSLIQSYNMNDWKQAIIEADTILDEMLDKMGYKGQSIGDKLKQIEPSDFLTLNQAWEAHKVRNRIAHSGTNFTLSKNEAERIIGLYREIFQEFFYI